MALRLVGTRVFTFDHQNNWYTPKFPVKPGPPLDHNPINRPPGTGLSGDSPKGDALTTGLALLWDDLGGNSDDWWQKPLKVSKVRPKSQTEQEYVNS
jgi:hypothetical protein